MTHSHPAGDAAAIAASLSDATAFEAVFERHFSAVYRFVRARAGERDADDLASAVFLVAFRRRGAYDPAMHDARPWLLGIAVNLLRNHGRTQRRLRLLPGRVGAEHPVDHTADTHTRLDALAATRRLNAALDGLRRTEREVFLLSALGELGYEDIARALGIPVGTVRSRLSRARARLRAALGEPSPLTIDPARPEEHGT